jgi:hypothetical protein
MSNKTYNTNLCKTLVSAAVLNYPPPTLINYKREKIDARQGADIVKGIYNFLLGKEVRPSDLVLVIEEGLKHLS